MQVRRREHLHRMADIERKAADMHSTNASVLGKAARDAYDQGALQLPAGICQAALSDALHTAEGKVITQQLCLTSFNTAEGEVIIGKELGNRSREAFALAQDARAAASAAANQACNHTIINRFKVCHWCLSCLGLAHVTGLTGCAVQVDLHGLYVEEALTVLDRHLSNLGGLSSPSDIVLQACCVCSFASWLLPEHM